MKISVDFDMIRKVNEANTGFSINYMRSKMITGTIILAGISALSNIDSINEFARDFSGSFGIFCLINIPSSFLSIRPIKLIANEQIDSLCSKLEDIDVYTNPDSLKDARVYNSEHKLSFSEGSLPKLHQNKYILVKNNAGEDVSILQEHVVGSRSYSLSVGEPEKQKQYRLVFNGA